MKVTRNDFLELAVHNVLSQNGPGLSYRYGIVKAKLDLKLNPRTAKILFEKGETEIE